MQQMVRSRFSSSPKEPASRCSRPRRARPEGRASKSELRELRDARGSCERGSTARCHDLDSRRSRSATATQRHDIDIIVDRFDREAPPRVGASPSRLESLPAPRATVWCKHRPGDRQERGVAAVGAKRLRRLRGSPTPRLQPRACSRSTAPTVPAPSCNGLGTTSDYFDRGALMVPDTKLARSTAGAIAAWGPQGGGRASEVLRAPCWSRTLAAIYEASISTRTLAGSVRHARAHAESCSGRVARPTCEFRPPGKTARKRHVKRRWDGVLGELSRRYREIRAPTRSREELAR